jgi:acyl carrier protein
MTADRREVLETVSRLIVEVVGDELTLLAPIAMDTSFNADLELESIEFVALAEKLQQHYGQRVDFVGWLSTKELDEIINLTVGELVELIVSCRS